MSDSNGLGEIKEALEVAAIAGGLLAGAFTWLRTMLRPVRPDHTSDNAASKVAEIDALQRVIGASAEGSPIRRKAEERLGRLLDSDQHRPTVAAAVAPVGASGTRSADVRNELALEVRRDRRWAFLVGSLVPILTAVTLFMADAASSPPLWFMGLGILVAGLVTSRWLSRVLSRKIANDFLRLTLIFVLSIVVAFAAMVTTAAVGSVL